MQEQGMAERYMPLLNQPVLEGPSDPRLSKSGPEKRVEAIYCEDEFEIRRKAFFAG